MKKREEAKIVASGFFGSVLCALGLHGWITSGEVKFCARCGAVPRKRRK